MLNSQLYGKKNDSRTDFCPRAALKCDCAICKAETFKVREKNEETFEAKFFDDFDFETTNSSVEKDFVFVLKRLIPPKNALGTIRVNIPETVCFISGEAKFIASTKVLYYMPELLEKMIGQNTEIYEAERKTIFSRT